MGYVGSSVKRVEDPRFIQGKGSYVGNITMPGMVHLAIKRSPYGHAKIKKINTKIECVQKPRCLMNVSDPSVQPDRIIAANEPAGSVI